MVILNIGEIASAVKYVSQEEFFQQRVSTVFEIASGERISFIHAVSSEWVEFLNDDNKA